MKRIDEIADCKLQIANCKLIKRPVLMGNILIGDITLCGVVCSFVASWYDEHVSITPYNGTMPTWDMMCKLKDIFYEDEEEAYQIHPKKSEYVDMQKNCLHLWGRVCIGGEE